MSLQCRCYAKSTGKQCKKTAIKNTFYCTIHQKCTQPIDTPKEKETLILKFIKEKLAENAKTKGIANHKAISHEIFKMLSTDDGIKFVNNQEKFKETVKKKLLEFIEIHKLPEFVPYYETILNEKYIPPVPRRRPQLYIPSRTSSDKSFSLKEIGDALKLF
jgi:hypothetical protein